MPRSLPRARSLAVLACLAGAAPVLATSTAAPSAAAATYSAHAASCSFSESKRGGYFTSLKVRNVSCAAGKKLARRHDACRLKHGVKGYCPRIGGFRCRERRNTSNPSEIDSRVTCTRGSKKVIYTYQQLLG